MDTVTLGRTGLRVTVAGLGCGGFSRIGIGKYGAGDPRGVDHAAGVVRAAIDAGVNFIDTAAAYGTEGAVGQGLAGIRRDSYYISTKYPYRTGGDDWLRTGADSLMKSLENSLRELRTDYVDIYHLHGVRSEDYAGARDVLLPAMIKAKEQGKIRFLGITELFGTDTAHDMFKLALPENHFDVIMVGYNIINPSAVKFVFPKAAELDTGVLCMFAVRSALSNPAQLVKDINEIIANGQAGEGLVAAEDALGFLTSGGTKAAANTATAYNAATAVDAPAAGTIMEAAYRFCRHTPPIHVVLTGTGNVGHLRENLKSISGPPLPDAILAKLDALFGRSDCVSGQ